MSRLRLCGTRSGQSAPREEKFVRFSSSPHIIRTSHCCPPTNSSCSSSSSWLFSSAFHERRPQNPGSTCPDDRRRTAPAFGLARPGYGDFENLAGSAVRRRPASRKRFLLRCRSSAPNFAGGFRKDRGRDEKGNQSESSVRENGSFAR